MKFFAGGTHVFNVDVNKNIYPQTHNTTDLGFSATLAFRQLYLSGAITSGAGATFGGDVTAGGNLLTAGSLDINGDADISGDLTGLDNVTSTNYIIGGHTIDDIDITAEFVDADAHIMSSKAIGARFALKNADTTGQAGRLNAIDDRNMAPNSVADSIDFKVFFSSKEGLEDGSTNGSNYQDVLFLSTWSDHTGGDANILAFDKSEKAIYHYQADQDATNWGTAKQLAYTDSDVSGDTTGTATNALHVLITDNENTDEENQITFIEGAGGGTAQRGLEADGHLTYNPSSGTVTATIFKGNIDAVNGDFDGTLEADALTVGGTNVLTGSLITTLGTISAGVWNGTKIASAYLDDDTAHLAGAQTFTGTKTLNSFKGTAGATVTNILDEDAMGSDSATALATQQSIKAYVDAATATIDAREIALVLNNSVDGVASSDNITYAVTHALSSRNVMVEVIRNGANSGDFRTVYVDVNRTSDDIVTLVFGSARTAGDYTVMIRKIG